MASPPHFKASDPSSLTAKKETDTMPKIYVGTYAKYNAGSIAGKWLDLEDYQDADEFNAACRELHKDEADPEFMFQDHEDIPEGMISESFLSADIWDWLDLDETDRELLSVYREHVDQAGTFEDAQDAFAGRYDAPEDWAADFLEGTGALESIPENLRHYFDYVSYARDAQYDGMTFAYHEGYCWVFYAA
jgi:antirestriction protein